MRIELILDWRRTRQQVVQQKFALRVKAGFNPFRESAGCTIVMRWQRRFKSCFSESQILILKPGQAHSTLSASIFADRRISPPTSVKEKEIHPFNVVHDDLANYRLVTKQEPPVQPVFTKNPRLDFKRNILGNAVLAYKSHPLRVVAVNHPTDYILGPIFIERQTGVFEGDTIGVNPLAVGLQHNDQLGNEINQLLKFLIQRVKFARGFVEDGSEEGEFIASSNGNPVLKGPPCESLGAFYQAAERNRNAPSRDVG